MEKICPFIPLSFAGSKESGKENSLAGRMVYFALFTPRKGLKASGVMFRPFRGCSLANAAALLFISASVLPTRGSPETEKGRRLSEPALAGEFRSPPFSGVPNDDDAKPAEAFATDVAERLSFLFRFAGAPGLLCGRQKKRTYRRIRR